VPDAVRPRSQDLQSKELPNTRIQPNRGWFQNSRVTDQKALERFREEMSTKARPLGPSLLVVLGCCAGNKRACAAWFRSSGLHLGEHVPLVSRSSVLYPVLLLIAICLQGPRRCPGSPPQGGGAPAQVNDAYTVLLREKKLPMALLEDPEAKAAAAGKAARASLVQTQPFAATFGAKRTRKRPKLAADSLADLAASALRVNATCARAARLPDASAPARRGASSACRTRVWARAPPQACCWSAGARAVARARRGRPAARRCTGALRRRPARARFAEKAAPAYEAEEAAADGVRSAAREKLFDKGQSRRIWGELFKVVDSSDVVIQARAALARPRRPAAATPSTAGGPRGDEQVRCRQRALEHGVPCRA
jgi:hypothetical protein